MKARVQMEDIHLWLNFYLEEPVFDKAQLDILQDLLAKYLPNWSKVIRVGKYEDSPEAEVIGDSEHLYEVVNQVAPVRRGLSRVVLSGAYEGVSFFLNTSSRTLPPMLNYFSIEIIDLPEVEKQLPWQWVVKFFEETTLHLPVYYGKAYLSEEFEAKNMVNDESGCYAVGVSLVKSLPGIYWLNYFGSPYIQLLQKSKLLSAPAYTVRENGNGILLALDETPLNWQDEVYQKREKETIEHIGSCYFFSKSDLQRKTIAPEFGI
jgi:hypothetical protein